MALPGSGVPLSLEDIADEFGGSTPHKLGDYYGVAPGVPTSGEISIEDFYGTEYAPWIGSGSVATANNASSATITNVALGATDSNRRLIVVVSGRNYLPNTSYTSTCSVGGTGLTKMAHVTDGNRHISIFEGNVTSGTSASVVLGAVSGYSNAEPVSCLVARLIRTGTASASEIKYVGAGSTASTTSVDSFGSSTLLSTKQYVVGWSCASANLGHEFIWSGMEDDSYLESFYYNTSNFLGAAHGKGTGRSTTTGVALGTDTSVDYPVGMQLAISYS